ncbi:MAG: hypothetical protein LBJ12_04770 [Oscillospiraceae bacterium]|jgi:hypothetical protein|nr:hypothetical protein [Oscillospiraceae bacterium]
MSRLIKNEIKSTAHYMMGIYVATIVTIGLLMLAFITKIKWLVGISGLLIAVVPFLLFFFTIYSVIRNFASSLYGKEGYLSFTLPVKGGKLLASKTIVSVLWMLVSYFIMVGVILGGIYYISVQTADNEGIQMIKELLGNFINMPNKGVLVLTGLFLGVYYFLQMLVFIADIYFAITLANVRPFQNHNVAWGIAFSFLFFIPTYVVNVILTNRFPFAFILTADDVGIVYESMTVPNEHSAYLPSDGGWMFKFGIGGMILQLIVSAALLYLTAYLINRKTNVK